MKKTHIIITGTGRAGTTVLMILLTKLGIDTGFTEEILDQHIYENCKAGLEKDIFSENAPLVVKGPAIMDSIEKVIKKVEVKHIIVPIRNFESAANSRIKVHHSSLKVIAFNKLSRLNLDFKILKYLYLKYFLFMRKYFYDYDKKGGVNGGLWDTSIYASQQTVLEKKFIRFVTIASKYQIPITFINFPKLINDEEYLFNKLRLIFPNLSKDKFKNVFDETVDYKET